MMRSDAARNSGQNIEPGEIEALLPWYAAGTLRRRDRQRVEAALRQDPSWRAKVLRPQGLARQSILCAKSLPRPFTSTKRSARRRRVLRTG